MSVIQNLSAYEKPKPKIPSWKLFLYYPVAASTTQPCHTRVLVLETSSSSFHTCTIS